MPRVAVSGSIVLVTEATRDLLKRALKLSHKERDVLLRPFPLAGRGARQ